MIEPSGFLLWILCSLSVALIIISTARHYDIYPELYGTDDWFTLVLLSMVFPVGIAVLAVAGVIVVGEKIAKSNSLSFLKNAIASTGRLLTKERKGRL